MSPIAPNIILFYDNDALAVIADDVEHYFAKSPMLASGYRIARLDNRGQSHATLADIKDAALFLLISIERLPNQELSTHKRTLTESALYQHLNVGGQRLGVPIIEVKLRAKNAEQSPSSDALFTQSEHYHLLPLQRTPHCANEIVQRIEQVLGKHLDSQRQQIKSSTSLLSVAGFTPDSDVSGDPNLARQLAVIFAQATDLADDEQFRASSDGADLRLNLRWAMRNLGFGHRKGAIANLRRVLSLDDGHLTANFWLSRLLSDSNREQSLLNEAENRSQLMLAQLEHYYPDYDLLRSLALLHQSRASYHLHRYEECQRQLQQAVKLHCNHEVLAETVRRTLQKIIRDGDIRQTQNNTHIELAVDALRTLFIQDHGYYYATVRNLSESFSAELVGQLTRQLDIRLQKEVTPLFRSEHRVALFCTDLLAKPQLAPRDAKPLPSWQQYELCRDSAENQLTQLQQIARHQQANWLQLYSDEQRLKQESAQATALPQQIDNDIVEMKQSQQALSSTRLATLSCILLAIISVTLLWFPAIPTKLASIPFVICFILSSLFAIQWRRHSERFAHNQSQLHTAVSELSAQLETEIHPNLSIEGLFQRYDFLASQLRQHVDEETQECNERRQNLLQQLDTFIELVDAFEESLSACDGKFNPFPYHSVVRWQPLALMAESGLIPPVLAENREPSHGSQQGLCYANDAGQLCRWAAYFNAPIDDVRWQRLQPQERPQQTAKPRTIVMPSVDNIINFKAKAEETH